MQGVTITDMALKLDNALLDELGLGALPDGEKQLLLRQIYEKLEMNVGMRLANQMSNEQLDEFERFVDSNDDKGAFQWLEANFPNYKAVVNEEFEKLKLEIRQVAPQMLAMAGQNAQAQGVPQQQASGQPQPHMPPGQPMPPQPGFGAAPGYGQHPGFGQQQPPMPGPQQPPAPAGYQPQPGQPYPPQQPYGQPGPGQYSAQHGFPQSPHQQPQQPQSPPQPQYGEAPRPEDQ